MTNSLGKKKQALETKIMLSKALKDLIEEDCYDEIAIYHILEKAGVSRRTFYRHFSSKEDLMDYTLTMFIFEYYGEREKFFQATCAEDVFYVTLNFMYKNRKFIRSLILSGDYDKFASKFNDNATVIFKTFGLPWNLSDGLNSREIDYVAKGLIGAYMNVIKYWIAKDDLETPDVIAKDLAITFSSIPNYFATFDDSKKDAALDNLKNSVDATIPFDELRSKSPSCCKKEKD